MKKYIVAALVLMMSTWAMAESRADKLLRNLTSNKNYVTVVSHRADWRNHPENSIPGIQSSIDMGVDMIEIDVQRTKDGVLVLQHDQTVDRCTNGKGKISELTYAEIQKLGLKPGHQAWTTRNHVPTLEEVLNLCKGKILINIDKGYDYFQQVYELMEKTGTTKQVIIKGGQKLQQVQAENGDVLNRAIFMPIVNLNSKDAEKMIDDYLTIKPVAIECCIGKYNGEVERLLQKIRATDTKVWINSLWPSLCDGHDDDRAVELKDIDGSWGWILKEGATLIQTDRPAELLQYLKKQKKHKLK